MNLAALFSGGKDSTFSIYKAQQLGHQVVCLITIMPQSAESHLLHHPNIGTTALQAESMNIPQIIIASNTEETQKETELIKSALIEAKTKYSIKGIVHGGILSEFQRSKFESVAKELELDVIAPIWRSDQKQYMHQLVDLGFEFIITSVSCDGLDSSWLGKKITKTNIAELEYLSEKYHFNLSFEGGEAETFVLNCPLFRWPIALEKTRSSWDGYRGTIEILQAKLEKYC